MTISIAPARNEYTANAAQTIFNYTFKIFQNTDLNVYITPAGQDANDSTDITTAYTVTGLGDEDGGTITLSVGTNLNDLVTIVSDIPSSRTIDYQNNGDFRPETVNNDFDRVVSIVKKIEDTANRSALLQQSQQDPKPLSLPTPKVGLGLRWNADETGLENFDLSTVSNEEIASDKVVINQPSLLSWQNYASAKVNQAVNMKERITGNGGGAMWDAIAGTGSANGIDVVAHSTLDLSLVLRTFTGVVHLSKLGALSTIDNSAIVQYALDNYDVITPDRKKLYPCNSLVITKAKTKLMSVDGVSGLISNDTEQTMLGINAAGVTLQGVAFDGNSDKVHTLGLVRLYPDQPDFTATGNTLQNIVGNLANNPVGIKQYAFTMDTFGNTDVNIQNNKFKNIIGYDADDAQAGVGFAGGMYITSDNSGKNEVTNTNPSSGIISTNRFIDIATAGIDGDISHSDAEGIRIFQTQLAPPAFVTFDFKMDNNYFRSIQKSAIKSGGAGGLKISNTTIISDNSNDPDNSGLPMLAAMRLQEGSDSTALDTTIRGNFVHGMVLFCANTSIDGLFHESGEIENSAIYIFSSNYDAPVVHDIFITNLRIKKTNVILNTAITAGATNKVVFRDIEINDVRVERMGDKDSVNFRLNNIDGITTKDIRTYDPELNTELCYLYRDCDRIKQDDIYGETTDQAIDVNETTATARTRDYELVKGEFFASLNRKDKTTRFVSVRNSANLIEKISILGLKVSTPQMVNTGNHDILIAEAPNLQIKDVAITVRNEGGTNRPQSGVFGLSSNQGSVISDVSMIEEGSPVGTKYVVQLSGGDKTQVRGVSGADRGVNLIGGDNINVADVTSGNTPLVSTATNLTQSNIVTWV